MMQDQVDHSVERGPPPAAVSIAAEDVFLKTTDKLLAAKSFGLVHPSFCNRQEPLDPL
jgi:hypothetical protein